LDTDYTDFTDWSSSFSKRDKFNLWNP